MMINEKEDVSRLALAVSLLVGLALVLVVLALSGHLRPIIARLWEIFQNKEQLRAYVESWGAWAPAAFIVIQATQVVLAPIPGEFTGAVGGFIFGALPNVLYSSVGLTLGSTVAFLAARIIGLPLVKLVVGANSLEKLHFITERRGIVAAFVLFIIPGFPKDILSYLLGISPMGFLTFLMVCGLGRFPGTVMLSFSGSALYDENWSLLAGLSLTALTAVVVFFLYWQRIELWLKKAGRESL